MRNMKPLISIIIPTYNRAHILSKTIKSVLEQSYKNFELLICDDGSTDETERLVKSIKDTRIIYLKQENKGPGAARNLGLKNAKGEIIAFLDSDDEWLPKHLEYCIEFFELYPEADMVYTQNEIVFSEDSRRKPEHYSYKKKEIPYIEKKEGFRLYKNLVFNEYLQSCISATPCTVVKKEVFDKIGLFNEDLSSGQDYEMWLRISNKFRIGVIRQVTVKVLAQAGSISESILVKNLLNNKLKLYKSIKEKCELDNSQKEIIDKKILEYHKNRRSSAH